MKISLILLVAVLAAHPSLGARIPDINVTFMRTDGRLPTVVFRSMTKNSIHVNANEMTDKVRPEHVTPAPPRKATFITECDLPASSTRVYGLCWMDETTVIILENNGGGRLIKFNIDLNLRLCTSSVFYSDVYGWRLSCAPDGEIYVADAGNKVVRIIKHGNITKWKPYGAPDVEWGGIAVNNDLIALDIDKYPLNLYARDRRFMYRISSEADNYDKNHLSISPSSSHLVACSGYGWYIFIHDLTNHQTIKVGSGKEGGISSAPWSSSFDVSEQYVMVCESNHRISIFDIKGNFMHVLEIGPGGTNTTIHEHLATTHREGKPSLLAVRMEGAYRTIKIYSLST